MTTRLGQFLRVWGLPLLIVAIGAFPIAWTYLINADPQQWQVDIEVYREAGISNLTGRPVYEYFTPPPQDLPFTYPPFASILAIPLALLPFGVVAWLWFLAQVAANIGIVRYAARGLIARAGSRGPLLTAVLTVAILHLLPVSDGFRFAQVNAFLVLACLLDLMRPKNRWLQQIPQGVLVGLATSIKLTPGVFIVYFIVTKQWRAAMTAIATAATVTIGTFFLLPGASVAFWGGALQDPERLGPNDGTSNQSIRGVLMRLGLEGTSLSVLWLLLAGAAAVAGFGLARRAHRQGRELLAAAAVGLTAVLVSPVSWIHHFHWLVLAIAVLVGTYPLRDKARLAMAAALYLILLLHLPWWGQWHLVKTGEPFPEASTQQPFWMLLNNAYGLAAVLTLAALWWLSLTRPEVQAKAEATPEPGSRHTPAADPASHRSEPGARSTQR